MSKSAEIFLQQLERGGLTGGTKIIDGNSVATSGAKPREPRSLGWYTSRLRNLGGDIKPKKH